MSVTPSIDGNISISAWVNFSNFDNTMAAIISKTSGSSGYGLEKTGDPENSRTISFWVGDGSSWVEVKTNTLLSNTWYHITGTNDGFTSKIYVNGLMVNSIAQGNPSANNGDFKIGLHSSIESSTSRYWNGLIDEVAE